MLVTLVAAKVAGERLPLQNDCGTAVLQGMEQMSKCTEMRFSELEIFSSMDRNRKAGSIGYRSTGTLKTDAYPKAFIDIHTCAAAAIVLKAAAPTQCQLVGQGLERKLAPILKAPGTNMTETTRLERRM